MRSRGHVIGNHGYCHYDGWKVRNEEYIADVRRSAPFTSKVLFRPPYGRLRQEQYNWLKREYKVVFWDLMPYDFDAGFGPVRAVKVLKRKIRPGSIIVLHDNPSYPSGDIAEDLIAIAAEKGYSFDNCEVTGCN
jgi:peptidoglycan/xylan/chitin deacetylase (PgdA/CDA1 family)